MARSDQLGLTGLFQLGQSKVAQFEHVLPRRPLGVGLLKAARLPSELVGGINRFGRHELPGLIRCEREDGREHFAKIRNHPVQGCLRGAPARRICGIGVEPIFYDIVINGRQFHRDKLAYVLVHDMKLVIVVGFLDFLFEFGEFVQNPAVQSG